jgi:hypothetical protein
LERLVTSLAGRLAVSGSKCKSNTALTAEICNFEGLSLMTIYIYIYIICDVSVVVQNVIFLAVFSGHSDRPDCGRTNRTAVFM